ncbi:cupin domain-containing protein [Paenarthrobacter nitroguajacolicus]|uniref:cupin domain-containing protein n=1 Tax=Paenarthrobacter nitroguajacolicus TaxID=211146 RepID=UPI00341269D8
MSRLTAGTLVDARKYPLDHLPVEPWQKVHPAATTASQILDVSTGAELGLWEMSAGRMTDIEVDELFVVLTGSATLEFISPQMPSIELQSGSIVRLEEGMQTRWTVIDAPLRKLYILPSKIEGENGD